MEQFPRFTRGKVGPLSAGDLNRMLESVERSTAPEGGVGALGQPRRRALVVQRGQSLGPTYSGYRVWSWFDGALVGTAQSGSSGTIDRGADGTAQYDARAPIPLLTVDNAEERSAVLAVQVPAFAGSLIGLFVDPSTGEKAMSVLIGIPLKAAPPTGAKLANLTGGNRISQFEFSLACEGTGTDIYTGTAHNLWEFDDVVGAGASVTVRPAPNSKIIVVNGCSDDEWYTYVVCGVSVECATP